MTAPLLCCIVGGVAEMFPVINNSWPRTLESHCGKLSVCRDTAAAGVISLHNTTQLRHWSWGHCTQGYYWDLQTGAAAGVISLHRTTMRRPELGTLHLHGLHYSLPSKFLKFFTVSHPFLPILTHVFLVLRVLVLNFYDFSFVVAHFPCLSIHWRHLWDIRDIHGYPWDFNVSGSGDTLSPNPATYFEF